MISIRETKEKFFPFIVNKRVGKIKIINLINVKYNNFTYK